MTEEERAALYRAQVQARERAALARYKALSGSASAYALRLEQTESLMHDGGWDPVEYLTAEQRDALGN
jgi:FAD/FMN-containing dehydrogenase